MPQQFSSLKKFQALYTPQIIQTLSDFFEKQLELAKDKDRVLEDMVAVLKEFVLRGGKRLGPLMVILGYQLAKQLAASKQKVDGDIVTAACSAETHHLYLLNLDDMADRDVLRHGGKTLEEYYKTEVFADWSDSDHHGRSFSSIAGSLLNSYTFEILNSSGFEPKRILKAINVITEMLFTDTGVGWQIQYYQNNESVETATEERFMKGLEYVTSRYKFVGPLLMGLALALDESDVHFDQLKRFYRDFGRHVGIAFQIQDDIIGVFGDPKETGKAVGNDIREGKKTLLIQRAYHQGNAKQKHVIAQALNNPLSIAQLENVQTVMKETGSLAYSQQLAEEHVQLAIASLNDLPACEEVEVMRELAEYMVKRKV